MPPAARSLAAFALTAGAVAAVALAALAPGAAALTPTPSAPETPTPTPTASPQSTITIRFVRDGEPVEIDFFTHSISTDGINCTAGPVIEMFDVTEFSVTWPPSGPSRPVSEACTTPGVRLLFSFGAGREIEIAWNGSDVVAFLEIPVTGVTPSPGKLPESGGANARGTPGDGATPLLAGVVLVTLSLAVLLGSRRLPQVRAGRGR